MPAMDYSQLQTYFMRHVEFCSKFLLELLHLATGSSHCSCVRCYQFEWNLWCLSHLNHPTIFVSHRFPILTFHNNHSWYQPSRWLSAPWPLSIFSKSFWRSRDCRASIMYSTYSVNNVCSKWNEPVPHEIPFNNNLQNIKCSVCKIRFQLDDLMAQCEKNV